MAQDYVTIECARLLRQKGSPLQKVCKDNGERVLFYDLPKEHPDWSQCDAWYYPTLWEAKLWLLQKGWEVVAFYSNCHKTWCYQVNDMSISSDSIPADKYDCRTFTEALQSGIMKALELIEINK